MPPLANRMDTDNIGLAAHSFGAFGGLLLAVWDRYLKNKSKGEAYLRGGELYEVSDGGMEMMLGIRLSVFATQNLPPSGPESTVFIRVRPERVCKFFIDGS